MNKIIILKEEDFKDGFEQPKYLYVNYDGDVVRVKIKSIGSGIISYRPTFPSSYTGTVTEVLRKFLNRSPYSIEKKTILERINNFLKGDKDGCN